MPIFEVKTNRNSTYYVNCDEIEKAISHVIQVEKERIDKSCFFPLTGRFLSDISESDKNWHEDHNEEEKKYLAIVSAQIFDGKFIDLEGK